MTVRVHKSAPALTILAHPTRDELSMIDHRSQVVVDTPDNIYAGEWEETLLAEVMGMFQDEAEDATIPVVITFCAPAYEQGEAPEYSADQIATVVMALHMGDIGRATTGAEAKEVMERMLVHAVNLAREGMVRTPF